MVREPQLALDLHAQAVSIAVVQLTPEWLETFQNREPDPARRYCTNAHAFHVVGAGGTICDVPPSIEHLS